MIENVHHEGERTVQENQQIVRSPLTIVEPREPTETSTKRSARTFFDDIAPRYERVAHQQGSGLAYISTYELAFIRAQLQPHPGARLLDVGSGTGRIAADLLERGANVTCLDLAPRMLAENKIRNGGERANFICADASQRIPLADQSVDGIVCCRVLKYMATWPTAISEMARVVRPGGRVVLEVATRFSCESLSLAFKPMVYHLHEPHEISAVMAASGLTVVDRYYGTRLPFAIYQRARSHLSLWFLLTFEDMFARILAPGQFCRSVLLAAVRTDPDLT